MTVLSDQARQETWARWMQDNEEETPFLKAELRAAVDAIDEWVNDNAAAMNLALPQPFRGDASVEQKAMVLTYVVAKRYLEGS